MTTITYYPVWVVVAITDLREGSGYPLAVFTTEKQAEAFVAEDPDNHRAEEFALQGFSGRVTA